MRATRSVQSAQRLSVDSDQKRVWGVAMLSLDPVEEDGKRVVSQADFDQRCHMTADFSAVDEDGKPTSVPTFFTSRVTKAMAEEHLAHINAQDADHDFAPGAGRIVQSRVTETGESLYGFPDRSWVIASEPATDTMELVEDGTYQAFSVATWETRTPTTLTIAETGEDVEAFEVIEAHCQLVSFVEHGAIGDYMTIREKPMSDKKTWMQSMREKMGLARRTLDDIDKELEVEPAERGAFADNWQDRKKGSAITSALYLFEDCFFNALYSDDKPEAVAKAIKTAANEFADAIKDVLAETTDSAARSALVAEARETFQAVQAVRGAIDREGKEPEIENTEEEMKQEDLAAIRGLMDDAVKPLVERIEQVESASRAAAEPETKTEPAKEPAKAEPQESPELAAMRAKLEALEARVSAPNGDDTPAIRFTDEEVKANDMAFTGYSGRSYNFNLTGFGVKGVRVVGDVK